MITLKNFLGINALEQLQKDISRSSKETVAVLQNGGGDKLRGCMERRSASNVATAIK